MESKSTEIVGFYLNQRLSVQQISEKLDISAYKVRKVLRVRGVSTRSISEAVTFHHITKFGLKEFKLKEILSHEDELLKVAGVMLYSGEGTKKGNVVALSNSDPEIIKLFLQFLRKICGIASERVYVTIHHYEDHDPETLIRFWSSETKIPKTQFYKPFLHARKRGTYRSPSRYGTVTIQYADKRLLSLILLWIKEYQDRFGARA